jgi:Flp pilus assembly protein TadG
MTRKSTPFRSAFRRGLTAEGGAAAVEYGLLLPALLLFSLGLIDVGRLLWTQATLDRSVVAAARCATVDTKYNCASAAQIQAYAADQAFGLSIDPSAFAVATAACGNQVTVSFPFDLITPWVTPGALTLTATACYPN